MGGSFKKFFAKIENTLAYKKEKVKIDFTVELDGLLKKRQMSRTELASAMGVSAPYVSKIMRGESNFTIETMVELAEVLDSEIAIHLSPIEENSLDQWFRVVQPRPKVKRVINASFAKRRMGLAKELDISPTSTSKGVEENGYASAA